MKKDFNNHFEIKCCNCGKLFSILKTQYEWRKNIRKQKTICCSVLCSKQATKGMRSITQKGKSKSESQSLKLKENAKINPNYGMKGKHHKPESCNIISEKLIGRIFTKEHKLNLSGERHHLWKGGVSLGKYCKKFNNKFKEDVRNRDNRICQLCGKTEKENGRRLDIHHIHGDKANCYPDCIALCEYCNFIKVEKYKDKRRYYEDLFMNNLNNRGLLFWSKRRENKSK